MIAQRTVGPPPTPEIKRGRVSWNPTNNFSKKPTFRITK